MVLLIVHTRLISAVQRECSSFICFHSFSRLPISALCFRMLSNLTKQNEVQGLFSRIASELLLATIVYSHKETFLKHLTFLGV